MKKTGYYLGAIFIGLGLLSYFSIETAAQEQEIEAIQYEQVVIEEASAEAEGELTCDESFEIDSAEIERWWISICDATIKIWDTEVKVCEKHKEEKTQGNCKGLANQKYYTIIKDLAKKRKLKAQKVEKEYGECQAEKGQLDTEEDIKK